LPQLLTYIETEHGDLKKELLQAASSCSTDDLCSLLSCDEFAAMKDSFLVAIKINSNFRYWWTYIEMIGVLLMFTRAQRDGNWLLHLQAFKSMLPYFYWYNQTNYARWEVIYLNETNQLPQEVKEESKAENFVVKRSPHRFNQVEPDQSQEWLSGVGKKAGGIIGITKSTSALCRCALSYNLGSHLGMETRLASGLGSVSCGDECIHNETTKGRKKMDTEHEDALVTVFQRFWLFSKDWPNILQNIATKDLATEETERDLLEVAEKGQCQLEWKHLLRNDCCHAKRGKLLSETA